MNEQEKLMQEIVDKSAEKVLSSLPNRKDVFADANKNDVIEAKQKSADFIKAVYANDLAKVKALSEGTSTEGKELVPEYFANEIVRLAPNYGVVRKYARNFVMPAPTVRIPTASTVTAYRVAEKSAITASMPATNQVVLTAKKVAVLIPMSNELLKDASVNTVDLLTTLSAEALSKHEDLWGFNGTTGTEGIFLNSYVPPYTMTSGMDDYTDVTADDLLGALSLLDESALSGAKWYMSFAIFNIIRGLKDTYGRYIVQEPAGGQPATLWNLPIVFVRTMPKPSDQGSHANKPFIAVGDLSYMIFGDMRQYEISISKDATIVDTDGSTTINLFQQDMSAVRVIERVDIELAEPAKAFAVVKTHA